MKSRNGCYYHCNKRKNQLNFENLLVRKRSLTTSNGSIMGGLGMETQTHT